MAHVMKMIEDGVPPTPQSESGASLAPKITTAECRIDWSDSSRRITNLIRATTPQPGAWTTFRHERYVITSARFVEANHSPLITPGAIEERSGLLMVGTGDGAIEIKSLKPSGKREMQSAEWLRGARLGSDERFE